MRPAVQMEVEAMPYIPSNLPMENEGRLPDLSPILAHWSHSFDFMGNCNRCHAVEGTALASGLCAGWRGLTDKTVNEIAIERAFGQAEDAWGNVGRPSLGMRWARGLLIVASCAISVWTFLFLVRWILP